MKVSIKEEDVVNEIAFWKSSVVGYVMGKKPYYPYFKAFVAKYWAKDFTLVYLKDGFFMVRFKNGEDVSKVLSQIHTFEGRPVIMKRWNKNVNLQKEILETVPVWLRIHDLPVHCHNEKSVSKVCSSFSKPIYIDKPETHTDKGIFVRVMVEVEVTEDSMAIDIHGVDCHVEFEYEWKPVVCKLCQRVDHIENRCPLKITQLQQKPKKSTEQWVVKKKGKLVEIDNANKVVDVLSQRDVQTEKGVATSNAFAILEVKEDIPTDNVVSDEAVCLGDPKERSFTEIIGEVRVDNEVVLDSPTGIEFECSRVEETAAPLIGEVVEK
ncbi:uncharacterized protein LOC132304955 [Cornus florida]|uniref:uncharacterized protein LOC132304955 n=1 Tax=Cornus florida TaxID=4283 RepID=UPI002897BBFC|nr:uncharacterized protein LOC132304955 [Cornus florida]